MRDPHRREATAIIKSGPTPSSGRAWLLVRPGTPGEGRFEIGESPLVIGSEHDCDVRLADRFVSHRHADIRRTPGGVVLRDLRSRNGTFVEQIAVKEAVLPAGARLRVGQTAMALETDDEAGRLARMIHSDVDDEALANIPPEFAPVVGTSPAMRRICALLAQLAPTDLTICLLGETGTGKDVLAHAVHARSPRAGLPFVVFDSGAVAPTLIESELFGHKKGAFTGAVAERRGAFERAQGGTLFLDEIGELSLDLQPKLLRALEQRTVQPVGGTEDVSVDVRIIAATNRDLETHVREGKFREDLFFRLSTALVTVPPLRERQQDLVELVKRFLAEAGKPLDISPEARAILEGHDWPGNVRELKNVVTAAAALASGPSLEPKHLVFFKPRHRSPDVDALPLAGQSLEAIERAAIEQTLHRFQGNKSKAARALGIAASTLYEKIRKYRPRRKTRA